MGDARFILAGVVLVAGSFAAPTLLAQEVVATSTPRMTMTLTEPGNFSTPDDQGPWGMWWGVLDSEAAILDLRPGRFALHSVGDSVTEPGPRLFGGSIASSDGRWKLTPMELEGDRVSHGFRIAEHDDQDLILIADTGNAATFSRSAATPELQTRFHLFTGAWREQGNRTERLILSPGKFELKVRPSALGRWSTKSFGTWAIEDGKLRMRYVADLQTRAYQLTGYRRDWELLSLADDQFVLQDSTGEKHVYERSSDPQR